MAIKAPEISGSQLKSKEKTRGVMGLYGSSQKNEDMDKKVTEEKNISSRDEKNNDETLEVSPTNVYEMGKKIESSNTEIKRTREKHKYNLHVTIDSDVSEFIDELVEETRDNKSNVVNKILYKYMREYRSGSR